MVIKNNGKTKYEEITRAKISDTRSIVISECSKGGYTIAQQLSVIDSDGRFLNMYIKGAFHIKDLEGLYHLRDALTVAIHQIEDKTADEHWDDDDLVN